MSIQAFKRTSQTPALRKFVLALTNGFIQTKWIFSAEVGVQTPNSFEFYKTDNLDCSFPCHKYDSVNYKIYLIL